ncbi:MAG: SMC-Scp complex subunit ScpB [Myxococcales bacterium]|nr:SMC-Scp complex subunit ScpB [Myxococcales bacterium]
MASKTTAKAQERSRPKAAPAGAARRDEPARGARARTSGPEDKAKASSAKKATAPKAKGPTKKPAPATATPPAKGKPNRARATAAAKAAAPTKKPVKHRPQATLAARAKPNKGPAKKPVAAKAGPAAKAPAKPAAKAPAKPAAKAPAKPAAKAPAKPPAKSKLRAVEPAHDDEPVPESGKAPRGRARGRLGLVPPAREPDLEPGPGGAHSEAPDSSEHEPFRAAPDDGAAPGVARAAPGGDELTAVSYDPTAEVDEASVEDTRTFLKGLIEALIFVADHPLTTKELARAAKIDKKRTEELVAELSVESAARGVRIEEVAGGLVLRSNPLYAPYVRNFVAMRPVRLSRAQLETLAIIAYRQPLTRPEIDDIRGVDSGPVLKGLLERDLIKILGKKDEPGRPMLYGTTPTFLELFSMQSLRDLPTLKEFTELSEESRSVFEREIGEDAPEGPIDLSQGGDATPPPEGEATAVAGESSPPYLDDGRDSADDANDSVLPSPEAAEGGAPGGDESSAPDSDDDDDDEDDDDDDDDDEDDDDDDDDDEAPEAPEAGDAPEAADEDDDEDDDDDDDDDDDEDDDEDDDDDDD